MRRSTVQVSVRRRPPTCRRGSLMSTTSIRGDDYSAPVLLTPSMTSPLPKWRRCLSRSAVHAAVLMMCALVVGCDPNAATSTGPARPKPSATLAADPAATPGSLAAEPAGSAQTSMGEPEAEVEPATAPSDPVSSVPPTTAPPVFPAPVLPTTVPTAPPTEATVPPAGSGGTTGPKAFPGPSNTGVPAGTQLMAYTGPCTIITDNTVIDSKTVNCALDIKAAKVVIKRSMIKGPVGLDTDLAGSERWSYTLQDSEVDGGTGGFAAVGFGNMTIIRVNVHGGPTSIACRERSLVCRVQDSWLHGQFIAPGSDWHLGGFLSNGGSNVELVGNTIVCDAKPTSVDGGCTGDVNLFGDFAKVSNILVDGNLLRANTGSAYCTFGGESLSKPFPHADRVVYRNNIFERGINRKCGKFGPVSSFNVNGPGNSWTNNRWDDGEMVPPAN